MSTEINNERSFAGVQQLSLRSILLGILGSCVITASSIYVALRLSALPWPTVFVAVLSMALLKILGKTTLNEINITQTAMSAGAMVAGGLAFTIPGLWITGIWKGSAFTPAHVWQVMAVALAGVIIGTVLSWFLRQRFVDREALPYPIGEAAAETIIVGDTGGKKAGVLFGTMGLTAIFTYLRDNLGWIPTAVSSNWLYAKNFYLGIWVSPMAVGIGYIIGILYTGVWFLGAVLSYLIIIPLGPALGFFSSNQTAVNFKNTLGIGLMVGTGAGILIAYLANIIKRVITSTKIMKEKSEAIQLKTKKDIWFWALIGVTITFALSIACGIGVIPSLLLMIGVVFAATMAAIISGETGINPMEIFGIIILLAVRAIVHIEPTVAFFIAGVVAVACGYSGDLLFDYKAGRMLKTNPLAQLISQVAGGIIGAVVATFALFAVINQFGGLGPDKGLPAAQAFMVSQMVHGIGDPLVFAISVIIGAVLYLLKVPAMTLGIGVYLPFEISAPMFIGGLIRFITDKFRPKSVTMGNIASSGMFGGEGITGVTIAIYRMIIGG